MVLNNYSKAKLKEMCIQLQISTKGTRKQMIARITNAPNRHELRNGRGSIIFAQQMVRIALGEISAPAPVEIAHATALASIPRDQILSAPTPLEIPPPGFAEAVRGGHILDFAENQFLSAPAPVENPCFVCGVNVTAENQQVECDCEATQCNNCWINLLKFCPSHGLIAHCPSCEVGMKCASFDDFKQNENNEVSIIKKLLDATETRQININGTCCGGGWTIRLRHESCPHGCYDCPHSEIKYTTRNNGTLVKIHFNDDGTTYQMRPRDMPRGGS